MASEPFLNELLGLFQYPLGSGRAVLAGTLLPLQYCSARFCLQDPDLAIACVWSCCSPGCHLLRGCWWLLLMRLIGMFFWVSLVVVGMRFLVLEFLGLVGFYLFRKRFRLNRKNSCTPCGVIDSFSSTRFGRGCVTPGGVVM